MAEMPELQDMPAAKTDAPVKVKVKPPPRILKKILEKRSETKRVAKRARDEGGDPADKRHRAAQLAKPATSAKPNKEKGSEWKEGDVVVYAGPWDGVLLKFGKYKGGGKNTECKNAHDETKKPQSGQLRRATPAEIKIFKDDVAAFERWKQGGKTGEKPEMSKVAKYADEGSAVDEKAIETAKEQMVDILDFVAFTNMGGGSGFIRDDPLSVMVAFDQYLSKANPGRGRKYNQNDLRGSSPAKRKQLRDAQVAALKEYEDDVPTEMKEKNKLMSGAERLRRAQARAKATEEKLEELRKKSNQVTLAEWSWKNGKPVKREGGEITRVFPGYFLEDTVVDSRLGGTVMNSCLMKAFGGEEGVRKKAPELLKPIFG